jgi:hypothetical protein
MISNDVTGWQWCLALVCNSSVLRRLAVATNASLRSAQGLSLPVRPGALAALTGGDFDLRRREFAMALAPPIPLNAICPAAVRANCK